MIKKIAGITLFIICGWLIWLEIVGSHDHIAFRPYMLEDWLIYGAIFLTFIFGFMLLFRSFKSKSI